ncbi:MAG: fibronectin type III domain-containing protein, partial [Gammaproteobacteria bacterium]|nr:fibronectin type III domain-containing protein [Gammaproteobacteria bacterium]NIW45333.1 hypothetical protein [Gammaproteobacteria bacterium]NIX00412.1 hypothetical protein [Phycisphaerae bacterium]
ESLGYVDFDQYYYNDTEVAQGDTYYYKVKSCIDITCSVFSTPDSGWRGYINTVTSISASDKSSSDHTLVAWSSTTGADYYKVYRSDSFAGTKYYIGQTNYIFFYDTEVSPQSPHYYWVLACNSTHCSEFYDYDTGQRKWPVVQNVDASDGGYPGYVRIIWDVVSGADSYEVYYSSNGGTSYLGHEIATSNSHDYYLTQVGFEYSFAVTPCFDGSCGSTKSATDIGWLDFPRPTGVSASFDTEWNRIQVAWNEVDPDAWYYIFRDTVFGSSGKTEVGFSGTAEGFSDDYSNGALPGVSYKYWIVACPHTTTTPTDPGCSAYSDSATGRYVPARVQNVAASDGTSIDHVLVTWDEVSGASYRIERSEDPFEDTPVWTYVGARLTTSFEDTSAVEGVRYWYRVKACGPEICGEPSGFDLGYLQSVCYALTLTTVGSGTLTGEPTNSLDCSAGSYIEGESITLYAGPDPEWLVDSWSGSDDDTHTGTINAVTMPASAHEVTVTFVPKTYTLFVYKNGNGTITSDPVGIDCGSDCEEDYDSGTIVTLTATPDTGYIFSGWSGNCTGTGTCEVTMTTGRGVTATFTADSNPIELL